MHMHVYIVHIYVVVFTPLNLSATFLVVCTRVSIFDCGKSKLEKN